MCKILLIAFGMMFGATRFIISRTTNGEIVSHDNNLSVQLYMQDDIGQDSPIPFVISLQNQSNKIVAVRNWIDVRWANGLATTQPTINGGNASDFHVVLELRGPHNNLIPEHSFFGERIVLNEKIGINRTIFLQEAISSNALEAGQYSFVALLYKGNMLIARSNSINKQAKDIKVLAPEMKPFGE